MAKKEIKKRIALKNSLKRREKKIKTNPNNPVGRPEAYTKEIGAYICREIAQGRTITKICKETNIPALATVMNWLNSLHPLYKEEFLNSYIQARKIQAEVLADQTNDIADDGENDTYIGYDRNGKKVVKVNTDNIQRSKLRVENRRWLAAHLLPTRFGDKVQLTGKDDEALIPIIPTKVVFNLVKVADKKE
jgi:flagellar hook-associated protein FlgK